ncbi:endonuclease domain-containing protein [Photobacterium profundum]|uniref:endonuclease domain-containing protein n=1 Tax=Photobacterium profundum TaxID=74109 RepID=UPI003D0BD3D9
MNKVFNNKQQKAFRQKLRNDMPEPEKRLWSRIRSKQLLAKFRRQHGIGNYIVDFYCSEKKLVIELDGDSHFSQDGLDYDKKRDAYMNSLGIKVLRFTNLQVITELDGVVTCIVAGLERNPL